MLERASRPGYVAAGTAVADEVMDGVGRQKSLTHCRVPIQLQKYQLKWQRHCTCVENVVEHQRVASQVA